MQERWTVVLLGVLCSALCLGCTEERDAGVAASPAGGRFVARGDWIVHDTRTGLEWTRRDDDNALPWEEADRYCQTLSLDGQTGWRLPEIDELAGLYDEEREQPCGDRICHLDVAVSLTEPYVWSATDSGPSRRFYLDFALGTRLSPRLRGGLVRRVLCVRRPAA